MVVGNKYLVGKKVASGSFGVLRLGKNIHSGDVVIIKLEHSKAKVLTLQKEFQFYNMLGTCTGRLLPNVDNFLLVLKN